MNYSFVILDTETTGFSSRENDVIEISMYKLAENEQKTWLLKPLSPETISPDALRVNKHKLEDLLHRTAYGRENYLDPHAVIVDIENWLSLDNVTTQNRCIIAHNAAFDKDMLEQLWNKCGAKDSFPFGRRFLDTMMVELFLNVCEDKMAEGYALANLVKKYGVKNDRAHSAAADTKATKEVFEKQVAFFKKALGKNSS